MKPLKPALSLTLILTGLLLTSCTFQESISDSVKIVCTQDADCPEDYYCETRLKESKCILLANRDDILPKINEGMAQPEIAKQGTALKASFTLSEDTIFDELKVFVARDAYLFSFKEDESDVAENSFVFDYEVVGNEPEGRQPIKVYMVDEGGNPNEVDLGFVTLDFQAPNFISGTSNLDWYRAGDSVTYTARFTEPLANAPVLSVTRNGEAANGLLTLDTTASDAQTYVYTSQAIIAADDGTYGVSFSGIVDVVGNVFETEGATTDGGVAAAGALGLGFKVDAVLPAISDVVFLRSANNNFYEERIFADGHEMVLCFNASDDYLVAESIQARVNQGALFTAGSTTVAACAAQEYVLTYTVTGEEAEGFTFVALEASDVAGNRTDQTFEVVFDFLPPELTIIAFNPPHVREGMTATLLLTANEPLAGALDNLSSSPVLTWESDEFSLPSLNASTRTVFGWEYKVLIEDTPDGVYTIATVTLEDVVGNGTTVTVSDLDEAEGTQTPDLKVDSEVPKVEAFTLDRQHLSAQEGFNELNISFSINEDIAESTEENPNPLATLGGQALECNIEAAKYLCTFVFTGEELEGLNLIQVQVKDLSGNYGYASHPLLVDFTAPTLLSGQVVPAFAKLGDEVVLSLTFDEMLDGIPDLSGTELPFVYLEESQYAYAFSVTDDLTDGDYHFDIMVTDVVGNTITVPVFGGGEDGGVGAGLQIDVNASGIINEEITLNADRFSLHEGHNEITLSFEVDEDLNGLNVRLDGSAFDCGDVFAANTIITCTYTLLESDVGPGQELLQTIIISGTDAAGNGLSESRNITLDNRPPQILSAQLSPASAKLGDVIVLSLTFNEILEQAPELIGTPLPFELFEEQINDYVFSFSLEVTADIANGNYNFELGVQDTVGNQGQIDPFDTDETGFSQDLIIDATPPLITSISSLVERYSLIDGYNHVQVAFQVDEVLAEDLVGAPNPLVKLGTQPLDCALMGVGDAGNPSVPLFYECEHVLDHVNDFQEGVNIIQVQVKDVIGNYGYNSMNVVLDFTPPSIDNNTTSLVFLPGEENLLSEVDALSFDTRVQLGFLVTESLGAEPVLSASPQDFTWWRQESTAGLYQRYDALLDPTLLVQGAYEQGFYEINVILEDEVGNVDEVPLSNINLEVDTVAPDPPDVNTPGKILYQRYPWGAAETDGAVQMSVTGAEGSVSEQGTIFVYSGNTVGSAELGHGITNENGTFDEIELVPADRAQVFIALADKAGNVSPGVLVKDVKWVATMGFKEKGSTLENPHVLTTSREQSAWLIDPLAEEKDGAAVKSLATDDVRVQGGVRWQEQVSGGFIPADLSVTRAVYDAQRGNAMFFGELDTWIWERKKWQHAVDGSLGVSVTPRQSSMSVSIRSHVMVYDSLRGVTVLFAVIADSNGLVFDGRTWEWDGASWKIAFAEDSAGVLAPKPRWLPAMVFDVNRGVTVLFGGFDANAQGSPPLNDIWEWDGSGWTEVGEGDPTGTTAPSLVYNVLAYDVDRQVTVLFGEEVADTRERNTWEWDGAVWVQKAQGEGPELAVGVSAKGDMVYDLKRSETVYFNGSETWAWNGESWTQKSTDGPVFDESISALYYDNAREVVVTFDESGIWDWNGISWQLVATLEGENSQPAPRRSHGMVYDAIEQKTIMFGGFTWTFWESEAMCRLGDTWSWDGLHWELLSASQTNSESAPMPRERMGMVYDNENQSILMFGGDGGGTAGESYSEGLLQGDLWKWQGGTWSQLGDDTVDGSAKPAPRMDFAIAYDTKRYVTVLFGGRNHDSASGAFFGDTWEWDGGTWTLVAAADPDGLNAPVPRHRVQMVFDAQREKTVLFGGERLVDHDYLGDTWTWDGSTWLQVGEEDIAGIRAPLPRSSHAMTFDADREAVLLVGGICYESGSQRWLNDTWIWDGAYWAKLELENNAHLSRPAPRDRHTLTYEPYRHVVTLFGGRQENAPEEEVSSYNDLWEFNQSGGSGVLMSVQFAEAQGPDPRDCFSGADGCPIDSLDLQALAGAAGGYKKHHLQMWDQENTPDIQKTFVLSEEELILFTTELEGTWVLVVTQFPDAAGISTDSTGTLNSWCLMNDGETYCSHESQAVNEATPGVSALMVTESSTLTGLEVSVDITHPQPDLLTLELRKLSALGAELKVWTGYNYESLAINTQSSFGLTAEGNGGALEMLISDPLLIARIMAGQEKIHLAISNANSEGVPERHSVAVDYLEVGVVYHFPYDEDAVDEASDGGVSEEADAGD